MTNTFLCLPATPHAGSESDSAALATQIRHDRLHMDGHPDRINPLNGSNVAGYDTAACNTLTAYRRNLT